MVAQGSVRSRPETGIGTSRIAHNYEETANSRKREKGVRSPNFDAREAEG